MSIEMNIKSYGDYSINTVDDKFGVKFKNKWIIDPKFRHIEFFENESVFMIQRFDNIYTLYDKYGNNISNDFNFMFGFYDGFCVVENNNLKLGAINSYGDIILDFEYSEITYPEKKDENNIIKVVKDNSYGEFIYIDGKIISK